MAKAEKPVGKGKPPKGSGGKGSATPPGSAGSTKKGGSKSK